jgi:hypothetical protein
MASSQLRNVNFGKSKANLTGSGGVGYTLYNSAGDIYQIRTTSGVYQLMSGSGLYAALISFPTPFSGSVVWDTGEAGTSLAYAMEQYNTEENDERLLPTLYDVSGSVQTIDARLTVVSGSVEFLRDMEGGRWKIESNRMSFYRSDNSTLIATFDLFDSDGNPSMESVFERRRV